MLVDVNFPVFAPSKEWNRRFKELEYDNEKTIVEMGSPFLSNQNEHLKILNGIYYTGLNAEIQFKKAGLAIYDAFGRGYEEALKTWNYRKEHDMKFIPLNDILKMYRLALYGGHNTYGVCDNAEQILNKWPHLDKDKNRHFITMTPIYRKGQPENDGWRWHKWGEYIGDFEPQCEYLYDEEGIDVVYVFHIYTLKQESSLGEIPPGIL